MSKNSQLNYYSLWRRSSDNSWDHRERSQKCKSHVLLPLTLVDNVQIDKAVTTWQKLQSVLKKLAETMIKIMPKLLASFGAYSQQRALTSKGGLRLAKLADQKGKNFTSCKSLIKSRDSVADVSLSYGSSPRHNHANRLSRPRGRLGGIQAPRR